MSVLDSVRVLIYRVHEKGLEVFLIKNEMIEEVCSYLEIYDEKEVVGEKSFCITGVRLSKEQLDVAKNAGWEEKSGVSKNLNVLVVKNTTSTSSKTEKAKSLGVKIVSLDEFVKMIQK